MIHSKISLIQEKIQMIHSRKIFIQMKNVLLPGTNGYPIPDPNPKFFSIPDPYPTNFQNLRVFRVSGILEKEVLGKISFVQNWSGCFHPIYFWINMSTVQITLKFYLSSITTLGPPIHGPQQLSIAFHED